jgi:5-formyltetrahydrofolate cyclo-ligase
MVETISLTDAKRALRARMRAARDALPPAVRQAAAAAILQRLCALAPYARATRILSYMSIGSEPDTHAFFDRARRDGKTVVLPRIDRSSKSLMLHRADSVAELVEGVWGIREPSADTPPVALADIDMLLMPGLAFDRKGNRLGYGAGYYDRLLAGNSTRRPLRVAAAFDCQLVDALPAGPADQPVHLLVTESQLLQFFP